MRKVLIITYYWPPAGGPGVQRILKFVKYLPSYGWQPVILTVAKGEFPAIDDSLSKEIPPDCIVYKTRHFEPNMIYKSFTGMRTDAPIPVAVLAEQDLTWRKRIAHFIRLNLFVPDAKMLWHPFAVRAADRIIAAHSPELIISSSPPPTVHLIARKIKRKYRLKWIADLRDPWTDIYSMQFARKNRFTRQIELRLENDVLRTADQITTVSRALAQKFAEKTGDAGKTHIIPNGYDPDDFPDTDPVNFPDKFIIVHAGKLASGQNPARLFAALERMQQKDKQFGQDLEIIFVGQMAADIRTVILNSGLRANIREIGYVEHSRAIQYMQGACLLLLMIPDTPDNRGIITGKVFEYLATRRPILCIGPPDSDLKEIFTMTSGGEICGYEEDPEPYLEKYYQLWQQNRLSVTPIEKIRQYSRHELTGKLVALFGH